MAELIEKSYVARINVDGIVEYSSRPGTYILPIELKPPPESRWVNIFLNEHKLYDHSNKRSVVDVSRNEIMLNVMVTDDFQAQYDIIKEVVENTNMAVDRENKKIADEKEKIRSQEEEKAEVIRSIKEKVREVK